MPALLETVRHPEKDDLAEARAELRLHLLGPTEPSSQERFAEAVRVLGAKAAAHRARTTGRTATGVPAPRQARPTPARITLPAPERPGQLA